MVLTRFARFVFVFALAAATGCSAVQNFGDKKDQDDDEATSDGDPTVEDGKDKQDAPCMGDADHAALNCTPPPDDTVDETTQFGLASFCKFAKNDKGHGCFTCTPRDLPDTRCTEFTLPEGFDPAAVCQHDYDEMVCKITDDKEFVYDFNEESKDEKLYNKIPLLLFGAKALLASKLKDKPEVKELVYGALDVVDKYKKAIFTNGDLGPMVDELAAIVMKAKPEYDQAKVDEFKAEAKTIIKAMQDKRQAGKLDTGSMLATFTEVLNKLPPDLVAPIMENLDLDKIIAALSGSGDDDSIQSLLAIFGDKTIDDLIADLEKPDPKTNTETGTGTGTGTDSGSGS